MSSGNLIDGYYFSEHEDCIIGDEEGLKSLIEACEKALENGECFRGGLGEYRGIKKLETSWFNQKYVYQSSIKEGVFLWAMVAVTGSLLLIGIKTVIQWSL